MSQGVMDQSLLDEILSELVRARRESPIWPIKAFDALSVLGEEYGELIEAVLQQIQGSDTRNLELIRTEAIRTAAITLRLVENLDHYDYTPDEQRED